MSSSNSPALAAVGLTMTYGATRALDDLSLSIPRGIIAAIVGRNGAGKTTLLETAEGYRSPTAGTVTTLGLDPVADRTALLPRIGVMLQEGGAWSAVHAREMLTFAAALHRDPHDIATLWAALRLDDCGTTPYRRLSGGLKQRLALAVALIGRPELVFVDEPTAGMDPHIRRDVWALLRELRADGVTVVLTTHYLTEAEELADRLWVLDHGRLLADGTPAELARRGESLDDAFLRLTAEDR